MEKKYKSTTKKKISEDLLLYEWYSHVSTFINICCDDASRA